MSKTKAKVTVMPYRLSVVDAAGKHLFWVDDEKARQLIKERKVEILRTKRRVRALRAIAPVLEMRGSAADLRGARYSHDRATEENPHGVWTLVRIPKSTRDIFTSVVDDLCNLKAA